MAQSVSNDALWVKLSEVEQKVDKLLVEQKSPLQIQEPAVNKPDSTAVKEEIITKIKDEICILGLSIDSHFKANTKNIVAITETIQKVWNIVSRIRKQQRESVEPQKADEESCFNFKFFKVRKTSLVIAMLSLLVLILTLFYMKQQNDYALLMDGYYRQGIVLEQLNGELKAIEEKQVKKQR